MDFIRKFLNKKPLICHKVIVWLNFFADTWKFWSRYDFSLGFAPVFGILFPYVVILSILIALCVHVVTMQAQRTAPPDMVCKDKFLIQSTSVPAGTIDEDITPSMVCFCSFVVLYSIFWLLIDCFGSLPRMAASTLKKTSWEWPSLARPVHQNCHQLMDYGNRG